MVMTGALRMSRRAMLTACAAAAATQAAKAKSRHKTRRPNIVCIMADDMGHADLGCYGSHHIKTPHIDGLAARGIKFTNAYSSSSVCSPTRTALLTGCYPGRFRIGLEEPIAFNGNELSLPAGTPTLPGLLRQLDYRTALVGKWHIGEPPASSPLDWGYDYFFGIHSGGTDYFTHEAFIEGHRIGELYENRTAIKRHGYLTKLLADVAIEQIKASSKSAQPMFLSLHFTAPHWPWEGPEDAERAVKGMDARDNEGGSVETYARMMESMDANIGRVLAELKQQGMEGDTLVIFTCDNGGERFSDTWPLTGMKGELLEGGIRVPVIATWPGHIPEGSTSEQVIVSMDMMPTLAAAAGGTESIGSIDGQNMLAFLMTPAKSLDRTIFWRHKARHQAAVRSASWKYLRIDNREFLFDLSQDERERANQSTKQPDRMAALRAAYAQWETQMLPYPEGSYSEDMSGKFADRTF